MDGHNPEAITLDWLDTSESPPSSLHTILNITLPKPVSVTPPPSPLWFSPADLSSDCSHHVNRVIDMQIMLNQTLLWIGNEEETWVIPIQDAPDTLSNTGAGILSLVNAGAYRVGRNTESG